MGTFDLCAGDCGRRVGSRGFGRYCEVCHGARIGGGRPVGAGVAAAVWAAVPKAERLAVAREAVEDRKAAQSGGLVPGQPCPACGKRVGRSAADRQREYRERLRKGGV